MRFAPGPAARLLFQHISDEREREQSGLRYGCGYERSIHAQCSSANLVHDDYGSQSGQALVGVQEPTRPQAGRLSVTVSGNCKKNNANVTKNL